MLLLSARKGLKLHGSAAVFQTASTSAKDPRIAVGAGCRDGVRYRAKSELWRGPEFCGRRRNRNIPPQGAPPGIEALAAISGLLFAPRDLQDIKNFRSKGLVAR